MLYTQKVNCALSPTSNLIFSQLVQLMGGSLLLSRSLSGLHLATDILSPCYRFRPSYCRDWRLWRNSILLNTSITLTAPICFLNVSYWAAHGKSSSLLFARSKLSSAHICFVLSFVFLSGTITNEELRRFRSQAEVAINWWHNEIHYTRMVRGLSHP